MNYSLNRKSTKHQRKAVNFCESVLNIKFKGNINDFKEVSMFLFEYYNDAKMIAEEASESYYSNFSY